MKVFDNTTVHGAHKSIDLLDILRLYKPFWLMHRTYQNENNYE